ncbi:hypothetical protein, partial [Enterococcus faecalis]
CSDIRKGIFDRNALDLHQFIGVLLEEEKLFNHILRAFVFHVGSYLKSSSSLLILRIFQHKFQE